MSFTTENICCSVSEQQMGHLHLNECHTDRLKVTAAGSHHHATVALICHGCCIPSTAQLHEPTSWNDEESQHRRVGEARYSLIHAVIHYCSLDIDNQCSQSFKCILWISKFTPSNSVPGLIKSARRLSALMVNYHFYSEVPAAVSVTRTMAHCGLGLV